MVDQREISSRPSESVGPLANDIHIWRVRLNVGHATLRRLASLLNPAERARAERFRFELHRHRFMVGRGLLRTILARYAGADPQELDFAYGANGKPCLATPFAAPALHFNLAHSDDAAMLAVTRAGPVGVDLERVRPLEDAEELVTRFFCAGESEAFRSLPAHLKPAAFFNLWTRKEAWLKATGEGIARSLHRVQVAFLPGEPARIIHLPRELGNGEDWSIADLVAEPGFAAALAVWGRRPRIDYQVWPDSNDGTPASPRDRECEPGLTEMRFLSSGWDVHPR